MGRWIEFTEICAWLERGVVGRLGSLGYVVVGFHGCKGNDWNVEGERLG
jgi:hypothetical protein